MDTMRVISLKRLGEFWKKHPDAERALRRWFEVVEHSKWKNLADLRKAFPSADPVSVSSGNTALVFNVGGNKYRIIAAIHYDKARLFVLRVLTHAEYDRKKWKVEL